jgi:uncharacterized membrane protein
MELVGSTGAEREQPRVVFRCLGRRERRVLTRILDSERVARDPNVSFEQRLTRGQRIADRVATFGGSWTFIGLFALFVVAWMAYNAADRARLDPFPCILLNLLLSCLAAVQAPLIMMSQNRMAAKDRSDARHDYEVNLKAELEIMELHTKIDELVAWRRKELLALQEGQLAGLERIELLIRAAPSGVAYVAPSELRPSRLATPGRG